MKGKGQKATVKKERLSKFAIQKGVVPHQVETTSLYFQKSVGSEPEVSAELPPRVEPGSTVVRECFHAGTIMETEDTAVCWHCRKWFSPPTAMTGHSCDTDHKVHVDLCTYGLMYAALRCVTTGKHHKIQRGTAEETASSVAFLDKVRAAVHPGTLETFVPMTFESGWARRPKRGAGKGATYIMEYRERIHELFMAGEHDKRHRKSPTQIMEVLTNENPGVITLPGYNEVSGFLGSLIQRAKSGKFDLPESRAPPISTALAAEFEALDVLWERTAHKIGQPAVGTKFSKKFGAHGSFEGTLTAFDAATNLYHINYLADDDEEDLVWDELAVLLKKPGEPRPPRPRGFQRADIYAEIKSRHTTIINGSQEVVADFPNKARFESRLASQRKARRDAAAGLSSVQLLR